MSERISEPQPTTPNIRRRRAIGIATAVIVMGGSSAGLALLGRNLATDQQRGRRNEAATEAARYGRCLDFVESIIPASSKNAPVRLSLLSNRERSDCGISADSSQSSNLSVSLDGKVVDSIVQLPSPAELHKAIGDDMDYATSDFDHLIIGAEAGLFGICGGILGGLALSGSVIALGNLARKQESAANISDGVS